MKYPKSETIVLLNDSSEALNSVLTDLKAFGYEVITILLDEEKEDLLNEPKVAIYELNPEQLDPDLNQKIDEIKLEFENVKFIAVFTKPLKYSMGEVKKQGLDCIYHLFFDRELFINEIFESAPIEIPTKSLNLDALVRVNIIELESEPLPFDLYLYLPSNKRTILYRPQGQMLDEKTIEKFKKYSHYNLYIKKSDLAIYKKHSAKILINMQVDPAIPLGVRNRKVASEIKKLMTGFFTNEDFSNEEGVQLLDNASKIVEEYIKETCKDKKLLQAVEAIAGEHMTNYTHSRNVATYCTLFGLSQGVGTPEELHMGGLLHDIGMSDLPESMLWVSEKDMTEKEFSQYKLHPGNAKLEISSRKLKVSDGVLKMILQHHERPDGSGFPYGLTADQIDPLAKVCAFADEFDRLTSVREGQKLYAPVQAMERISGKDGEGPLPFYDEEFHGKIVNDFSNGKPLSLEVPEVGQVELTDMDTDISQLDNFIDVDKESEKFNIISGKVKKDEKNIKKGTDYINNLLDEMDSDIGSAMDIGPDIDLTNISNEFPVNTFNVAKNKELFAAAITGDILKLQSCLDEGAHIDAQDDKGNTALMLAVQNGQDEVAYHLMNEGANIDLLNKISQTAIDIAESSQQKALFMEMEKYRHKNKKKKATVQTSKASGTPVKDDKEFNVNQRNKLGQTLVMQLSAKGNVEGVEKLINMGADVKLKDFKGHTPLIFAANQGHIDIVKMLIDSGADLDVKDGSGRSALLHAIEHKHLKIVDELLKKGARPDLRLNGLTALMIAAYTGQEQVVKLLLDYGAHTSDKDIKGKTAVEYALVKGHLKIAEMINGGPLKKSS